MTKFTALKVTVLLFSHEPDNEGVTMPPECHVVIPDGPTPVYFNFKGAPIGTAKVKRLKTKIIADLEIHTTMKNTIESLRLMRLLVPTVQGQVISSYGPLILGFKLTAIGLVSESDNADPNIKPLGDAVRCANASTKAGLH